MRKKTVRKERCELCKWFEEERSYCRLEPLCYSGSGPVSVVRDGFCSHWEKSLGDSDFEEVER
jgi:hypothetical protein